MGSSSLIIILVVAIIVVKLVAVHLYLKKKMNQPRSQSCETQKKPKQLDDE